MTFQEKKLMKGNEAIAEAAIRSGCQAYFGYPITPQNELIGYMAEAMPRLGRVFIQAESEIAAINMVYGAASTGARSMTSSSSPGISLKQEGISYAAGADLPFVYVNIVRGGPGLGSIGPAQSDYFQSTRGGGHGDYRVIVLAPASVQECADLTVLAFDLAEKWRMPTLILGDGVIGQMMEPVLLPEIQESHAVSPLNESWAVGNMNKTSRSARHITSINLIPEELENLIKERFNRYTQVESTEVRFEQFHCDDADLILVAYGTSARVCREAVEKARNEGLKVGLFRPITLWPFPSEQLSYHANHVSSFLSVEMSMGQMIHDIRLSIHDRTPVHLLSHSGGVVPTEEEVFEKITSILEEKK